METEKKIEYWAYSKDFDKDTNLEIQNLIQQKKTEELNDRFYKDLAFGTGGIRAIIGAGTNRINIYTIRKITAGVVAYLSSTVKQASVVIAHDNRKFSKEFAIETAKILATTNIKIWLFKQLTPTPMLSFTVPILKATAGIVITASHNPHNYNGYKIYSSDGAQIAPPDDQKIVDCINSIENYTTLTIKNFEELKQNKKIEWVPNSLNEQYYQFLEKICLGNIANNQNLNLLYSPLCGTGKVPVMEIMKRRNFSKIKIVTEHSNPDPNFNNIQKPNPEELETMNIIATYARENDELIIATDPDSDRIGVMSKYNSKWVLLNGNQIAQLLLYYYLKKLKSLGRLNKQGVVISTVVTSSLLLKIATSFGLKTYETATGFKNIAQIIKKVKNSTNEKFTFACEESNGYLLSDRVRDKDGVMAAMFFAEMTAELKKETKTPLDLLNEIYQLYGLYSDNLLLFYFEGVAGIQKISAIMAFLRNKTNSLSPAVTKIIDYKNSLIINTKNHNKKKDESLLVIDLLSFCFSSGSRVLVRASGTEPKIKFYLNLVGKNKKELEQQQQQLSVNIQKLINEITK